jgi:hypothetical protein
LRYQKGNYVTIGFLPGPNDVLAIAPVLAELTKELQQLDSGVTFFDSDPQYNKFRQFRARLFCCQADYPGSNKVRNDPVQFK